MGLVIAICDVSYRYCTTYHIVYQFNVMEETMNEIFHHK
jgi:hypothetical protein